MSLPAEKKRLIFKARIRALGEVFWSWIGAFVGIGLIGWLMRWVDNPSQLLLIGSFGASAVLLYGAPRSPFAQPRNLFGGHLISAVIGVASYKFFPDSIMIAAPLAVATAIAMMQLTHTLHPPGGATALIAVIGNDQIHAMGFSYILPVLSGALILFVAAIVSNRLSGQTYPEHWY